MTDIQPISSAILLDVILVLVAATVFVRITTFILIWFSERAGKYRITVKMVIPLLKLTTYGLAIYYIMASVLKLSATELVIFGGFLGAAIGFGLKDVFADMVGGIVITFEKPYQVGDKISIGEHYGEVTDIGIRATKLKTPDDNLVSVPNYLIFVQAVASANAGSPEMMVVIDLFIDPDSDTGLAMKILKEAVVTSKYVFISKKRPFDILLEDLPFYQRLRAKAYVYDLRYEFQFKSEVTERTWDEFCKEGIKAPKIVFTGEQAG